MVIFLDGEAALWQEETAIGNTDPYLAQAILKNLIHQTLYILPGLRISIIFSSVITNCIGMS